MAYKSLNIMVRWVGTAGLISNHRQSRWITVDLDQYQEEADGRSYPPNRNTRMYVRISSRPFPMFTKAIFWGERVETSKSLGYNIARISTD